MTNPARCVRFASCLFACSFLLFNSAYAADKKLTEDDKVEILRGLLSEYATATYYLPRSPKPLPFESDGTWDKQAWQMTQMKYGVAARQGDQVQITKINIQPDKIIFEFNHGMRGRSSWRDHVQVGMEGPIGTSVQQTDPNLSTSAPSGTTLVLLFNKPIPDITSADIKKILAPVLSFSHETATADYVSTLPPPVQQAIKANKVIDGMDRDQVLLALGRPRRKERNVSKDGVETEDWIYGDPPGKITFVTFSNSKVVQIKEAYADIGGTTATSPTPVQ
jgi:hypothetical protein